MGKVELLIQFNVLSYILSILYLHVILASIYLVLYVDPQMLAVISPRQWISAQHQTWEITRLLEEGQCLGLAFFGFGSVENFRL